MLAFGFHIIEEFADGGAHELPDYQLGRVRLYFWGRSSLPDHHLSAESKEVVKLGMGLVGTMAALVLGLLVASAKSSFDAQSSELTQASASIVVLDRVLAQYGPETREVREILRGAAKKASSSELGQEHRFSSRTSFVASCTRFLKN